MTDSDGSEALTMESKRLRSGSDATSSAPSAPRRMSQKKALATLAVQRAAVQPTAASGEHQGSRICSCPETREESLGASASETREERLTRRKESMRAGDEELDLVGGKERPPRRLRPGGGGGSSRLSEASREASAESATEATPRARPVPVMEKGKERLLAPSRPRPSVSAPTPHDDLLEDIENIMNRRIAGDAHLKTRQAALLDELRAADLNGDGHLELEEVAELLINEMHAKDEAVLQAKRTRVMRKYVLLLALMVFVMLLGNFGLTFAVVTMAKDTKISASAELQTVSGEPVSVASTDTVTDEDGILRDRRHPGQHAVKVGEATEPHRLDSRLPDEVWSELKYLHFTSTTGGTLHLFVQAWARVPSDHSLHGSVISVITAAGDLEFDGRIVTYADGMQDLFRRSGFEAGSCGWHSRRLQVSSFSLIGLFNSVQNWGPDFNDTRVPRVPKTFIATSTLLYQCTPGATNLCDRHGIPATHRARLPSPVPVTVGDANNDDAAIEGSLQIEWATTAVQTWADEAQQVVREDYSQMPNAVGWTFETVSSTKPGDMFRLSAQSWERSGERLFCSHRRLDPEALGMISAADAADLDAAFKGEVTVDGEVLHHFRLMHHCETDAVVDYLVRCDDCGNDAAANGSTVDVHPRWIEMRLKFKEAGQQRIRRYAYSYTSFQVPSAGGVNASLLYWPEAKLAAPLPPGLRSYADSASFADDVCSTTHMFTYRCREQVCPDGERAAVPFDAKIAAATPFSDPDTSIDATAFYWDLQVDLSFGSGAAPLTVAAWVQRERENGLNKSDADQLVPSLLPEYVRLRQSLRECQGRSRTADDETATSYSQAVDCVPLTADGEPPADADGEPLCRVCGEEDLQPCEDDDMGEDGGAACLPDDCCCGSSDDSAEHLVLLEGSAEALAAFSEPEVTCETVVGVSSGEDGSGEGSSGEEGSGERSSDGEDGFVASGLGANVTGTRCRSMPDASETEEIDHDVTDEGSCQSRRRRQLWQRRRLTRNVQPALSINNVPEAELLQRAFHGHVQQALELSELGDEAWNVVMASTPTDEGARATLRLAEQLRVGANHQASLLKKSGQPRRDAGAEHDGAGEETDEHAGSKTGHAPFWPAPSPYEEVRRAADDAKGTLAHSTQLVLRRSTTQLTPDEARRRLQHNRVAAGSGSLAARGSSLAKCPDTQWDADSWWPIRSMPWSPCVRKESTGYGCYMQVVCQRMSVVVVSIAGVLSITMDASGSCAHHHRTTPQAPTILPLLRFCSTRHIAHTSR